MIEIKFRAWDETKIVYDFTPRNITGTYSGKPAFYDTRFGLEVPPENVMQYTGLKDKNGKEIYEGDIILTQEYSDRPHSRTRKKKRHTGIVTFKIGESNGFFNKDTNAFNLHLQYSARWAVQVNDYGKFGCSNWGDFFDCEVIGNIYENPDLLNSEPKDKQNLASKDDK